MSRKILVICALGYATSSMIKKNIEDYLDEKGIKGWLIDSIGIKTSDNQVGDADIIVHSLSLDPKKYQVPLIDGIPLISGINKDETLEKILEEITRYENAGKG